jgi:hypothetical protein
MKNDNKNRFVRNRELRTKLRYIKRTKPKKRLTLPPAVVSIAAEPESKSCKNEFQTNKQTNKLNKNTGIRTCLEVAVGAATFGVAYRRNLPCPSERTQDSNRPIDNKRKVSELQRE